MATAGCNVFGPAPMVMPAPAGPVAPAYLYARRHPGHAARLKKRGRGVQAARPGTGFELCPPAGFDLRRETAVTGGRGIRVGDRCCCAARGTHVRLRPRGNPAAARSTLTEIALKLKTYKQALSMCSAYRFDRHGRVEPGLVPAPRPIGCEPLECQRRQSGADCHPRLRIKRGDRGQCDGGRPRHEPARRNQAGAAALIGAIRA